MSLDLLFGPGQQEAENVGNKKLCRSFSSYVSQRSQQEGEKDLSELAKSEKVEHAWIFDGKNSWHYFPLGMGFETKITNSEGAVESMGVTYSLPQQYLVPPNADSILYHIHPDHLVDLFYKQGGRLSKEKVQLNLIFPSPADWKTAAFLHKRYKGFRIVNPLGVTTYNFHREGTFFVTDGEIDSFLKKGLSEAINETINLLVERSQGAVSLDYKPF